MELVNIVTKLKNLEKQMSNLASRNYGERAKKALSEASRIEAKEDTAIDELDAGLADATLMICEMMKGE